MTPQETFAICGSCLTPGHFSSRVLTTSSSDARLFINERPAYYLSLDGRLFQIPRGAQSDGISAPMICVVVGRTHGGDDWIAGWFHDGVYRGWLLRWQPPHPGPLPQGGEGAGEWVKAKLTKPEGDDYLRECALVCGDTPAEAETLRWAVMEFGKRSFNPVY